MIPHSRSWLAIMVLMLVAVLLISLISVPAQVRAMVRGSRRQHSPNSSFKCCPSESGFCSDA